MRVITTDTPRARCPVCAREFDTTTSFEGKRPREGQISICVACGAINLFDKDLCPRRPTIEEMEHLRDGSNWDKIIGASKAIRRFRDKS